jgi:dTDP-4-dehydrorhamnose reductase
MKVLIVGGGGMLGHKLTQVLQEKFDLWTTFRSDYRKYEKYGIFNEGKIISNVAIENLSSVEAAVNQVKPDVIVNAIGIIKQIPSATNIIKTLTVNAIFPHQLAEMANRLGARLITVGTDCVFSGKSGKYTESDLPDAADLYGKSKNLGEVTADDCLTLRTSIIGRELDTAHGLVEWFLSNEGKTVKGFTKAVFSGFPTLILSEIIGDVIENQRNLQGLFHVSSAPVNKYDLLESIKKAYGANIEIEPFDDFEIDRSLDSTKFRAATGFKPMDWEEMIDRMAADNAAYENYR